MNKLNCLPFLAIIALFSNTLVPTEAIMEDAILGMLSELRARMCHPIPALGLPALDPFQISHMEYTANSKYLIDFSGSVTDLSLTGLSKIVVNSLVITVTPTRRSSFDISMPLTLLKSLYTAKGSVYNILQLAGDGDAEASVKDVRISCSWIFKTGIKMGIRSLKLDVKIGDIHIDFQNLIEEERINDFFHALVNELGLELLDDIWQVENQYVTGVIEAFIDNFLSQFTLADIIKIIGGDGDGDIFGDVPADC